MQLYGLIGYPLGHSFSKKYFTDKFEREGLRDAVYQNFEGSGREIAIHRATNCRAHVLNAAGSCR